MQMRKYAAAVDAGFGPGLVRTVVVLFIAVTGNKLHPCRKKMPSNKVKTGNHVSFTVWPVGRV